MNIMELDQLRKEIKVAFSDVDIIGDRYTLAHGEFYDSYRGFPDQNLDPRVAVWFASRRSDGLLEKDALEISEELRRKKIKFRNVHWLEVSAEYLSRYSFGFGFIPGFSRQYYFLAWMNQCMEGNEARMIVMSDKIIDWITECTLGFIDDLECFSLAKIGAVYLFFEYFSGLGEDSIFSEFLVDEVERYLLRSSGHAS